MFDIHGILHSPDVVDTVAGRPLEASLRIRGEDAVERLAVGPVVSPNDGGDQRVLTERTVELAAGERRTVTFRTDERYEMFRIDAFPA